MTIYFVSFFPFSYTSSDTPVFSVGFRDAEVAKPETIDNIVVNIVNTEAARQVEITVSTDDISGDDGVRPATAGDGKV